MKTLTAEKAFFLMMGKLIERIDFHERIMNKTKISEVKSRAKAMKDEDESILRQMKDMVFGAE